MIFPRHALHDKGFTNTNKSRYTGNSQDRGALAVHFFNRSSTVGQPRFNSGFRSSIGLHGCFVCSCFSTSITDSVCDSLERQREGCFQAGSTQQRPVLPSFFPPCRPAMRCLDQTGPYCVRDVDSTSSSKAGFVSLLVSSQGFVSSCFWKNIQAAFSFGRTRKDCSLGEQCCWRQVLPEPAQTPCRAPRCHLPVVCLVFKLDKGQIASLGGSACDNSQTCLA